MNKLILLIALGLFSCSTTKDTTYRIYPLCDNALSLSDSSHKYYQLAVKAYDADKVDSFFFYKSQFDKYGTLFEKTADSCVKLYKQK